MSFTRFVYVVLGAITVYSVINLIDAQTDKVKAETRALESK